MKIATFNINNVNRRLPNLLDWLKSARPDVACLQELKCSDLDFPVNAVKAAGYAAVTQVVTHGEFAVRGSLLDVFPMGSEQPFRIDLFDRDIDSIRHFDPDTQRSAEKLDRIRLLPATAPGRRA